MLYRRFKQRHKTLIVRHSVHVHNVISPDLYTDKPNLWLDFKQVKTLGKDPNKPGLVPGLAAIGNVPIN